MVAGESPVPGSICMSLANNDTVGRSRSAVPAWWAAVRGGETLLRRPPVVLGLAAAVALAIFVLATPRALPMLAGLLATITFGMAGPWLSIAGLRGRLEFGADRCRVGDRVAYRALITRFGRANRAARVEWPQEVARQITAGVVVPARRGLFPGLGGGPTIASDWPFGITTARRRLAVRRPLLVRPLTTPVRFPVGLVNASRPGRDSSTALPGAAGDIIGVRDHRPGDPSRSIHWPQTARRGELVVCERPGSAGARVRIVLVGEAAAATERSPGGLARLDAAVAVASSLVESWSARGADVELAWGRPDGTTAAFRPRNRRGLDEALDAVACLEELGPWPGHRGPRDLPSAAERAAGGGGLSGSLEPAARVDLEIQLALGRGPGPADRQGSIAARRIVIAFETVAIPEAIVLPASAAAATMLDRAFAEIGHDPDTR